MFCTTCVGAKRSAKGSPVPHYCDACGFPLTETGARVVRRDAAMLVAHGEALDAIRRGEVRALLDSPHVYMIDPFKVATETARRAAPFLVTK